VGRPAIDRVPKFINALGPAFVRLARAPSRAEYRVGDSRLVSKEGRSAMKLKSSLKSLKAKDGSVVVRRRGHTFVVNKHHPRWKARQG